MRLSSILLRAGVVLGLTATSAAAQGRLSTELFVARNSALAASTSLYGLGLTVSGGPVGLRASGALGLRAESVDETDVIRIGAWTGEVDLVLQPSILGISGRSVVAFSPYVFGGVGRISGVEVGGYRSHWTSASYGAGIGIPLTRTLGVSAEGRYRLPLAEAVDEEYTGADRSFPRGWEYRFGLSISIGG